MKRRIGILTYHHVINDGALLQSAAVVQGYRKAFPEASVEVVDYRPRCVERNYFKNFCLSSKNPFYAWKKIRRYWMFRRFIESNLPLSHRCIISDEESRARQLMDGEYDLVSVGSDEVWKIETGDYARPFPNIYWLNEAMSCKKVALAASANKMPYKELGSDVVNVMRRRLKAFDLISVRDDHTLQMIKHICGSDVQDVFRIADPTFVLETENPELQGLLAATGVDFSKKLLGVTFFDKRFTKQAFDVFRKQGYQILGLTAANPLVDIDLSGVLNPFQWAGIFKYLHLCLTNLFHGTVFSLKNQVPVLSFDYFHSAEYESKAQCLLKDFEQPLSYIIPDSRVFDGDALLNCAETMLARYDKNFVKRKATEAQQAIQAFLNKVRQVSYD